VLKTLKVLDIPVFSATGSNVLRNYDNWLESFKKCAQLIPEFDVFFDQDFDDDEEPTHIPSHIEKLMFGVLTVYLKDVALKHVQPFAGSGSQALKELETLLRPKELSARTSSMMSLLDFNISSNHNMVEVLQAFDKMYSNFAKETNIHVTDEFKVCHLLALLPPNQYLFTRNVFINKYTSFSEIPYLKFQSELRAVYAANKNCTKHSATPPNAAGVEYQPQGAGNGARTGNDGKGGKGKGKDKNKGNPMKDKQKRDEQQALSKDSQCAHCHNTGHTIKECWLVPGQEHLRKAFMERMRRKKSQTPPRHRTPQRQRPSTNQVQVDSPPPSPRPSIPQVTPPNDCSATTMGTFTSTSGMRYHCRMVSLPPTPPTPLSLNLFLTLFLNLFLKLLLILL
jgi:hypothetical protein